LKFEVIKSDDSNPLLKSHNKMVVAILKNGCHFASGRLSECQQGFYVHRHLLNTSRWVAQFQHKNPTGPHLMAIGSHTTKSIHSMTFSHQWTCINAYYLYPLNNKMQSNINMQGLEQLKTKQF